MCKKIKNATLIVLLFCTACAALGQTSKQAVLTITISPSKGGSTTPAAGAHTYTFTSKSTTVNISAVPRSGYRFVNWSGGTVTDPSAASTTVFLNADKSITANFEQITDEPPVVEFTGGPTGEVIGRNHIFTWKGQDDKAVDHYEYYMDDINNQIHTISAVTLEFTNLSVGSHSLWLRAVDNTSQSSQWVSRPFSIKNISPTVEFTETPDAVIISTDVTFAWQGSDEDGSVVRYEFVLNNETFGFDGTTRDHELTELDIGSHSVQLRPIDNDGYAGNWISYSFQIVDSRPSIEITDGPRGKIVTQEVTFKWEADTDWGNLSGFVLNMDGEEIQLGSMDRQWTYSGLSIGLHTFSLVAMNDHGYHSKTVTRNFTIELLNHPPVAHDDNLTMSEDGGYFDYVQILLLENDTDPDGDSLYIADWDASTAPYLDFQKVNEFVFFLRTTGLGYYGIQELSYRVSDGTDLSNWAKITVDVLPINDNPIANWDAFIIHAGVPFTNSGNSLLENDYDEEHDPLKVREFHTLSEFRGSLTVGEDGIFTYYPGRDCNYTDQFEYSVSDGQAYSFFTTVYLNVVCPPVANPDTYTVLKNTRLEIGSPGVLGNDTYSYEMNITAQIQSPPVHGTLTLNGDGSFDYQPNADYYGTDSFTYRAFDGELFSEGAAVAIVVSNSNRAPVASDDTYSLDEDTALDIIAPGVLSNDSDPDGDPLTAQLYEAPQHSKQFTLSEDGSFHYEPNANFYGTDKFRYKAVDDDGKGSSAAQVIITINPIPEPFPIEDQTYTTQENTSIDLHIFDRSDFFNIFAEDYTIQIMKLPDHGTITNDDSEGNLTYVPDPGFSGTDTFIFKSSIQNENIAQNTATVTIVVQAVNNKPQAVADAYTLDEDNPLTQSTPGVLGNDSDPDGDNLSIIIRQPPSHGTLSMNASGGFTYTPVDDYFGSDQFVYIANDGTEDSDPATVYLMIQSVNDPPIIAEDTYQTGEETPLTVVAPGLLENDFDIESQELTVRDVSSPTHGQIEFYVNGGFQYIPAPDFSGTETLTYTVSDGTDETDGTFRISVKAVNHPPVSQNDTYTMNEDNVLQETPPGLIQNDSDPDGDLLRSLVQTQPAHGTLALNENGAFTYTPYSGYSGNDVFQYHVTDGQLESAPSTVTIQIIAVNDPPNARANHYATGEDQPLTGNVITDNTGEGVDSDPEGDGITVVEVNGKTTDVGQQTTLPSGALVTVHVDGRFEYIPNHQFDYLGDGDSGQDIFIYRISDGQSNSSNPQVTITIQGLNNAPVSANDQYVTRKNTLLTVPAPGILENDRDAENDAMIAMLSQDVGHGTLTLMSDGSFSYTPDATFSGTDAFTYQAFDGAGTSQDATVKLTVDSRNEAPVAFKDSFSVDEDGSFFTSASEGVLKNDTDADNDPLSAILVTQAKHGRLYLEESGSFRYIPNKNYYGTDGFTYRCSDGTEFSNTVTANITILPVNDPPLAQDDEFNVVEDDILQTSLHNNVLLNDFDPDFDNLTAILVRPTVYGDVTLESDGYFSYDPYANFAGNDFFTYRVSDGTVETDVVTVTLRIEGVNDPPCALEDQYTTVKNNTLIISEPGVLANDVDIEGDTLTAVLVSNPEHGQITLSASGAFQYVPETDFSGEDRFKYKVNDGNDYANYSSPGYVRIKVVDTQDPLVAYNDHYTTDEDHTLNVSAANGILKNDTAPQSSDLQAVVESEPANGTLVLTPDGAFIYKPATDYYGNDSFTYHLASGLEISGTATVSITINDVADRNTAKRNEYSVSEDDLLSGNLITDDTGDGADYNGDSNAPHVVAILAKADKVETPFSLFGLGTLTVQTDGRFTFDPDGKHESLKLGEENTIQFQYTIRDAGGFESTADVVIAVQFANDPPAAMPDAYTGSYNKPLTCGAPGVLANDVDTDGDELQASLTLSVKHGTLSLTRDGGFSYTPETEFTGVDSFSYQASDAEFSSQTAWARLTIQPETAPPVANSDHYTTPEDQALTVDAPGILNNDTSPGTVPLNTILSASPEHGTLSLQPDGSFIYTPSENYFGNDAFSYQASNGREHSETAQVNIIVEGVQDGPPVANNDFFQTRINVPLSFTGHDLLDNDVGVDGPLEVILVNAPDNTLGTVTVGENGNYSYTPPGGFSGYDHFQYNARYLHDTDVPWATGTVTVAVGSVNDTEAPVLTQMYPPDGAIQVPQNGNILFSVVDAGYGPDIQSLNVTINESPILVNGQDQTGGRIRVESTSGMISVRYRPANPFQAMSQVKIEVKCSDLGTHGNQLDRSYGFVVGGMQATDVKSEIIDEAGATITDSGTGLSLIIPQNAVSDSTEITISTVDNLPDVPDTLQGIGTAYHFSPEGIRFEDTVTVRIPYTEQDLTTFGVSSADELPVYYFVTSLAEWQRLDVLNSDEQYVYVAVEEFCYLSFLPDELFEDNVEVTVRLNASTIPDTIMVNSYFNLRGSINDQYPFNLPDSQVIDWGEKTTITFKNDIGDYFSAHFRAPRGSELKFKIWSENADHIGLGGGWEVGTSETDEYGNSVVTITQDTILPVHFFNCKGDKKKYNWKPWENIADTVSVWFRVYMYTMEGLNDFYDPNDNTLSVEVRGDNLWGNGPLSWEKSDVILHREWDDVSKPGRHLFSGACYYPKTLTGNTQYYKFIIPPGNWEEGNLKKDRQFVIPEKDTTLAWVYYGNTEPFGRQTHSIPGRVEAEYYYEMSGVQIESTADEGGGLNVGWIDTGDWMEYRVDVEKFSLYEISLRVALEAGFTPGYGEIQVDGEKTGSFKVPCTEGWQNWITIAEIIPLDQGIHTIRLQATKGPWNINWIDFKETTTGVMRDNNILPLEYELHHNYPNPFNGFTTLYFEIPEKNFVTIKIYNILGQHVKTLVNEELVPGRYRIQWEANNDNECQISTGIYFYQMICGRYQKTRKAIYLK